MRSCKEIREAMIQDIESLGQFLDKMEKIILPK